MESSLLDQVCTTCKAVAEKASHVHIDHERISPYAASLPIEQAMFSEPDPVHHYLGHGEDTVAFFVTLDVINFGSGYFPHLHKRPGMSGYYTIASSLTDHYRDNGPLSARELEQLTAEDCMAIFGQDPHNTTIRELMQLFATALNDLGRYLSARFEGSFLRLVEAADASAERLVQLLIEMPYFEDIEPYDGLKVPFYKRAQIMSADLWLAFEGRGPGRFDDLDRLTMFADNLVPHVLRMDSVLRYEDDLVARIEAEQLIPSGSPEEVEIRACAVHVVERLVEELRRSGHDVTSRGLDYLLWNRGQQAHYKARPRHSTRTVFY